MTPNAHAWLGLIFLAAITALMLFGSAGTVNYWQAWVYLAVCHGSWALLTLYLMRNDTALLARRSKGGPTAETQWQQKLIMLGSTICFLGLLIVSGLDRRFGWSPVTPALVLLGDGLALAGFYIIFLVFKENSFASSTIGVAKDQRVISTGPYALVRHPMYAGGLIYLAGAPLALGSYWAYVPFAAMLPFLLWRLFDEERFLSVRLGGYVQYMAAVRWRLVPGVF